MNIRIERNTFVEPTQSRANVVQGICDSIMIDIKSQNYCEIELCGKIPSLYYGRYIGNGAMKAHTLRAGRDVSGFEYTKIRTCEMRLAFRLLQEAGYYIYEIAERWRYFVTTRPFFCGMKAKYTDFNNHID